MNDTSDQILQRVRIVSSLGVLLDGYNLTIIAVALIPLAAVFHLHAAALGLLASAMLLGSVVGGVSAGVLADRWGRRTLLLADLVIFLVFSLISALVDQYLWLVVCRFVVGIAVGADYAISPTYLAEFSPTKTRGFNMGSMWVAWSVGAVLSFGVGAVVVQGFPPNLSWRLLFALGLVPAGIGLLMRARLPESPRWLNRATRTQRPPRSWQWRPGLGRAWALVLGPWFLFDFSSYGLGLLLPLLLTSHGYASHATAIGSTGLAALVGGLGSLWAAFRIDRRGRMFWQMRGFMLATGGLWALAGFLQWRAHAIMVVVGGLMVVNFFMGMGPGLTAGMLPAEIFPTSMRAMAQGLATAFSRIGAVVGVFVLGFFETHGGFASVLMVTGVASLLGGLMTWAFRIEPNQAPLSDSAVGDLTR